MLKSDSGTGSSLGTTGSLIITIVLIITLTTTTSYAALSFQSNGSTIVTTSTSRASTTNSIPSASSSIVITSHSTLSSSSSGTPTNGVKTYKGTFTYIAPLGPFGINDSSGKPVEWNSTQTASGTFTFSVNPLNYTGTGTGQGSITVSTQGYCSGSVTVPYTFTIQAVDIPGSEFEVAFNTPTPSSAMVQLTCQGPTTGFNTANNPVLFLSVYPNGLSITSVPTTFSQAPTAGISYSITITPTN